MKTASALLGQLMADKTFNIENFEKLFRTLNDLIFIFVNCKSVIVMTVTLSGLL